MPSARPHGFRALPPEMLELIMGQIDDLGAYVAFSRLCQSTREVCDLFASGRPEGERRARELCLRAGFSRPKLFSHTHTWTRLTCAIVDHAAECTHCGEGLKRSPAMLAQAQPIYAETRAATDVRLVTALRQSVGLYSVDWSRSTLRERPCLSLLRFDRTPAGSLHTKPELVHHITMACRLAFTVPLQRIRYGWEADDDWCFDGYSESIFEESEVGAEAPSALNYRCESCNEDGLTCLDLLVTAGDV